MTESNALEFHNPYRFRLRIFRSVAVILVLATALAIGALLTLPQFEKAAEMSAVLSGLFAVVAAFFSLVMMWVARAADRTADEFRHGHSLADWHVPPAEWEAFLNSERAGGRRWGLAKMRAIPRVVIGRNGVYCGGKLTLWGMGGTVLYGVKVVSSAPMMLGFAYGASAALQAVTSVAAAGAASAGGARVGALGGSDLLRVPVPSGQEDEAVNVMNALNRPS